MSTLELPTSTATAKAQSGEAFTTGSLTRDSFITVEHCAYLLLGIVSLIAHLWGLGDRALHHDETLHATYSWYIFTGRGYIHDPLLHGPFLYYLGAAIYFLFGDNDFTARLGAALFGTILTLTPYLIRRELGRLAALLAAIYLLISPVFLYVGRFIRHDIYSVTFEMLVFVAIVRYASTRQPRWLYLGAAAFGLMITNQETSYLYLLLMSTPLVALLLWRVYRPGIAVLAGLGVALAVLVFILPGQAQVDGAHNAIRNQETGLMEYTPGPIFGWYPLETSDNAYALRIRNQADDEGGRTLLENIGSYLADLWLFFSHPAILLGMALLLGSTGLLIWLIWVRRDREGLTRWQRARASGDPALGVYASLVENRRWLVALSIFLVIYTILFTAFLTNLMGVVTGTTGSLLYWLAQHDVERGGQPFYYYLVLLVVYEPLLLLWATIGLLLVAKNLLIGLRRPNAQLAAHDQEPTARARGAPGFYPLTPLLLAWWSVGAVGIYSWAGEKMPWLSIHVALPLVLLGAWACQQVFTGYRLRRVAETDPDGDGAPVHSSAPAHIPFMVFAGIFAAIAGLGFILMTTYVATGAEISFVGSVVLLLTLVLFGLLTVAAGLRWGWRWSLSTLAVCVTLLGGVYTVRNAYRLTYLNGDVPREMLIYTQTSPDVMHVVRQLEEAARRRGGGLDMPIYYDNETVWQWYFRNFTNATNTGPKLTTPPGPEVQAVLMLQENLNADPQNRAYLEEGFRIQRLPLRWWFPEDDMYRLRGDWRTAPVEDLSLVGRALRAPFDDETVVRLWQFLLYRDTNAPLGSTDFVIAVRPALANQIGLGTGARLGSQ